LPEALVLQWYQKIEEARKTRLDEFRSLIGGNGASSAHVGGASESQGREKESLWQVWRAGFQNIHIMQTSERTEAPRLQSAS
jgi:hypothetical protein